MASFLFFSLDKRVANDWRYDMAAKIVCSMKGCWRYKDDPDDKFDGCCYRGDDASFVCPLYKVIHDPDISELEMEMIEDMVIRCWSRSGKDERRYLSVSEDVSSERRLKYWKIIKRNVGDRLRTRANLLKHTG